jgi:hypothetical protein
MRITAPTAPTGPLARSLSLFDGAPAIVRPLPGARGERRAQSDRRQLLLANPPAQERRTFDRRADDRRPARHGDTPTPVRKGLLIDVYA